MPFEDRPRAHPGIGSDPVRHDYYKRCATNGGRRVSDIRHRKKRVACSINSFYFKKLSRGFDFVIGYSPTALLGAGCSWGVSISLYR
jgi:hypothetical protein